MPYRTAPYYVGFVFVVILVGFWASYFAPLGTSMPLAFHVHAMTAMTWLAFLLVQHFSIHRRMNDLHRQIGWLSIALFPLLIMGLAMIIDLSADRYASKQSPFIMVFGPSAGLGMLVAIAAYLTLFYLALKHRRQVKLHAGYMLATPMILFESPMSRVIGTFLGPLFSEGAWGVLETIVLANAACTGFALWLYARDRRNGAPWLIAAGFMTLQSVLMWTAAENAAIGAMLANYAQLPAWFGPLAGLAAGGAATWLGWKAAPSRPGRAAAAAATA